MWKWDEEKREKENISRTAFDCVFLSDHFMFYSSLLFSLFRRNVNIFSFAKECCLLLRDSSCVLSIQTTHLNIHSKQPIHVSRRSLFNNMDQMTICISQHLEWKFFGKNSSSDASFSCLIGRLSTNKWDWNRYIDVGDDFRDSIILKSSSYIQLRNLICNLPTHLVETFNSSRLNFQFQIQINTNHFNTVNYLWGFVFLVNSELKDF